jgi:hypothetical protein
MRRRIILKRILRLGGRWLDYSDSGWRNVAGGFVHGGVSLQVTDISEEWLWPVVVLTAPLANRRASLSTMSSHNMTHTRAHPRVNQTASRFLGLRHASLSYDQRLNDWTARKAQGETLCDCFVTVLWLLCDSCDCCVKPCLNGDRPAVNCSNPWQDLTVENTPTCVTNVWHWQDLTVENTPTCVTNVWHWQDLTVENTPTCVTNVWHWQDLTRKHTYLRYKCVTLARPDCRKHTYLRDKCVTLARPDCRKHTYLRDKCVTLTRPDCRKHTYLRYKCVTLARPD